MIRKLATVKRIDSIEPHLSADRLEIAVIGGWRSVVGKGDYHEGQEVVFCEIDSLLPLLPRYSFLARSCAYVDPQATMWYRIKSVKLRGVLSQGLVLPVTDTGWVLGDDVTEDLGIGKFEPTISDLRISCGDFPYFVPKTDQERVQNIDLRILRGRMFHVTEKLDGTSCTVFNDGERIGVCSRNQELCDVEGSVFWAAARAANVIPIPRFTAVQGEIVGPSIQGNKYRMARPRFLAFGVFDITDRRYLSPTEFEMFCRHYSIPTVPAFARLPVPPSVHSALYLAEGASLLHPGMPHREGLVWVSDDGGKPVSFKTISNKFLLANEEC